MSSAPPPSTVRTVRRGTLALLAFWLCVAALLWAGFSWHEQRDRQALQAYVANSGELVIPRSRDGHFYVDGEVNHQPVRFLIDTGASSVAVSEALAQAAGLPRGRDVMLSTAGGNRRGRMVRGIPVKAGSLIYNDTTVMTGLQMGNKRDALLGQSFLRHFAVRIEDDEMHLAPARRP